MDPSYADRRPDAACEEVSGRPLVESARGNLAQRDVTQLLFLLASGMALQKGRVWAPGRGRERPTSACKLAGRGTDARLPGWNRDGRPPLTNAFEPPSFR